MTHVFNELCTPFFSQLRLSSPTLGCGEPLARFPTTTLGEVEAVANGPSKGVGAKIYLYYPVATAGSSWVVASPEAAPKTRRGY